MTKTELLSAKQLDVIEDLFEGKQEREILEKHKLSRKLYEKWLADEAFNGQLDRRVEWENRRSGLMLARSASRAVSSLVKLAETEQGETSRKACLDIITISTNRSAAGPEAQADNPSRSPESAPLPPEIAGKLLAVLAKEKNAS